MKALTHRTLEQGIDTTLARLTHGLAPQDVIAVTVATAHTPSECAYVTVTFVQH